MSGVCHRAAAYAAGSAFCTVYGAALSAWLQAAPKAKALELT